MKKVVKRVGKNPAKEKKINFSNQENCKLFKIPSPIFMEIIIFCVRSGKELLEISIACKKLLQTLFADPRPWLSLVLSNFPKSIKADQLGSYQEKLVNGFKDNSQDWKGLYIANYKKNIEISNQKSLNSLKTYFDARYIKKLNTTIKESKIRFYIKNGRQRIEIPKKSIKFLEHSLIITIQHTTPVSKCSSLSLFLFGTEKHFCPSLTRIIKEGKISLAEHEYVLAAMINSEIYTEYWLISYSDLASKFSSYSIRKIHDDISSSHGLHGYKFHLDLHNLTESLCNLSKNPLDFEKDGNKIVAWIEDQKLKIPKEKMTFNWKSLAFSDKITNVCIADFVLFSEFENPIFWGSFAGELKFEEVNGNEGDGYSLNISREDFLLRVLFRDKGKFWMLASVNFEIPVGFVRKIFNGLSFN